MWRAWLQGGMQFPPFSLHQLCCWALSGQYSSVLPADGCVSLEVGGDCLLFMPGSSVTVESNQEKALLHLFKRDLFLVSNAWQYTHGLISKPLQFPEHSSVLNEVSCFLQVCAMGLRPEKAPRVSNVPAFAWLGSTWQLLVKFSLEGLDVQNPTWAALTVVNLVGLRSRRSAMRFSVYHVTKVWTWAVVVEKECGLEKGDTGIG